MEKTAIVFLQIPSKQYSTDLEIPLNIPAERVINALCDTYDLDREEEPYIVCENPIALVYGKKTLSEFGVRNGSTLRYMK